MKNFKTALLLTVVVYAVLVLLRLAYVVTTNSDMAQAAYYYGNTTNAEFFSEAQAVDKYSMGSSYFSRNIARVKVQQDTAGKIWALEQAYEKVGTLSGTSYDFDKDEASLRKSITDFKAMTQREQLSGLKGSRSIMMAIGVPPESFDVFIETLKKIGKLNSFTVVKTDKTGDYRELQSKKTALMDARNSLLQLKKRDGKIEELMNLETKIYEIGKEIESLSAGINVFEAGKDYCTVNFTLSESRNKITIIARLFNALEWSLWKTLWIAFLLLLALGVVTLGYKVMSQSTEFKEFKAYGEKKVKPQVKAKK